MRCDEAKAVLMDLVYQEQDAELSTAFRGHFTQCRECAAEYMDLLCTRRLLGAWADQDPPAAGLVFVPAREKRESRLRSWILGWTQLRPAPALAMSLLLVLGFFSLANVRISYSDGRFGFQSGIFSRGNTAGEDWPVGGQEELMRAVDRMLLESEARNQRQTLVMMQRLNEHWELRQAADIHQIRQDMGLMGQELARSLDDTNLLLRKAVQQIKF